MNSPIIYELEDEQVNRINVMKILLIIFVIYLHNDVTELIYLDDVQTFAVPIWFEWISFFFTETIPECAVSGFFFISSLLLYRKSFEWKENIKKKVRTILVPYLLMNLMWFFLYYVFQTVPQTSIFFNNKENWIVDCTVANCLKAFGVGSATPILYPLWFLRNLFVLNLLSSIIKRIIDYFPRLSFGILCVFLLIPQFPFSNFEYLLGPGDLCMWCLGYYYVKYKLDLRKYDKNAFLLVGFCVSFVLSVLMKLFDLKCEFLIIRLLYVVNLMFWYCWFTKNLKGRIQRFFVSVSCYGFGIFLFHEMTLSFAKKLLVKLFPASIWLLLAMQVILPLIIFGLAIVVCYILKKYIPKIYCVIVGSRI